MEKLIAIPENVDVKLEGREVIVSGQKGSIKRDFDDPRFNKFIAIEKRDNHIVVKNDSDKRKMKAIAGTICAHIRNMLLGITTGFKYEMKILYTHFPISVSAKDGRVEVKNFLGEKGVRATHIVGKTDMKIEKDTITLTGINIDDVSQTASNIEQACKLTGRDRRIFVDGIYLSGRFLQNGEAI